MKDIEVLLSLFNDLHKEIQILKKRVHRITILMALITLIIISSVSYLIVQYFLSYLR